MSDSLRLPYQSLSSWGDSFQFFLSHQPPHMSLFDVRIELGAKGSVPLLRFRHLNGTAHIGDVSCVKFTLFTVSLPLPLFSVFPTSPCPHGATPFTPSSLTTPLTSPSTISKWSQARPSLAGSPPPSPPVPPTLSLLTCTGMPPTLSAARGTTTMR